MNFYMYIFVPTNIYIRNSIWHSKTKIPLAGRICRSRGGGQDPARARRRHQHALQRVQGVSPDAGVLQGPLGHGAVPAGGGRGPRAQDRRDAHRAHGGQHGRTRRGREAAARFGGAGMLWTKEHHRTLHIQCEKQSSKCKGVA